MKSIVEGEMLATSESIETQLNPSSHAQNWSTLLHTSRASGESCRHDGERIAEGDGERSTLPSPGEVGQHKRERVSRHAANTAKSHIEFPFFQVELGRDVVGDRQPIHAQTVS
jgi:hypothetical protein